MPGHDLGDVQSGQGKSRARALEREMGGVVRADEEVRTRAGQSLDAAGEGGADGADRANVALHGTRH